MKKGNKYNMDTKTTRICLYQELWYKSYYNHQKVIEGGNKNILYLYTPPTKSTSPKIFICKIDFNNFTWLIFYEPWAVNLFKMPKDYLLQTKWII